MVMETDVLEVALNARREIEPVIGDEMSHQQRVITTPAKCARAATCLYEPLLP